MRDKWIYIPEKSLGDPIVVLDGIVAPGLEFYYR
jgi:hypothetical protein